MSEFTDKKLKEARVKKRLSHDEAANLMNVAKRAISEMEAGKRSISADELAQFSRIYNVDVRELLFVEFTEAGDEQRLTAKYSSFLKLLKALPIIDEWLENDNPNTRRAVTEGLRILTSRPYFKDNPNEAIRRIVALKEDPSEYVRKSVGNALRDISKKFPELIKDELNNWKLESKEINQVYKLASKLIN